MGSSWSPHGTGERRLVVIVPALNEAATISSVIEQIPREIDGVGHVEVVVVDDGSSDQTADLSRKAGAHVASHFGNMGVGRAFAMGIDSALSIDADIIVKMDADGQFAPVYRLPFRPLRCARNGRNGG